MKKKLKIELSPDQVTINGKAYEKYVEVQHPTKKSCKPYKKTRRVTPGFLWRNFQATLEDHQDHRASASRISPFSQLLQEMVTEQNSHAIAQLIEQIGLREVALSYYGSECQWCGEEDEDELNASVFNSHDKQNFLGDTKVFCSKCGPKHHLLPSNKVKGGKDLLEKGFIYMLKGLEEAYGLDSADRNFTDTPSRVARAYLEMMEGIDTTLVENTLDQNFPDDGYQGMVIVDNIECFSMCPHHFLPVKYTINFGYLPKDNVLGISKIPRFIKSLARGPLLQETLTKHIIEKFDKYVKPAGSIVTVAGYHMCMGARGIEMPGACTTTSAISGLFDKVPAAKEEFFDLIAQERNRI